MDKTVLVPVAQGTEEMEAVIIIDMMRRAGINVKVAGENEMIVCSRGVRIVPDVLIEDIPESNEFDAIVLPGGTKGAENLLNNGHLEKIVKYNNSRGSIIAAICAAPTILDFFGILDPKSSVTSHPSVRTQLLKYNYKNDKVVNSGNIMTSRGAGTAFEFSLKLIETLIDSNTAERIANDIVLINEKNGRK
jgi:DJ-1 family protein